MTAPITAGKPNGSAAAAILAASFGLLVLGIVVIVTELNVAARDAVFAIGKAWIPGAERIGPYSGKETIMLVAWLVSWALLHPALRHRQVNLRAWFGLALGMLLVAIILIWPPVWHLLTP